SRIAKGKFFDPHVPFYRTIKERRFPVLNFRSDLQKFGEPVERSRCALYRIKDLPQVFNGMKQHGQIQGECYKTTQGNDLADHKKAAVAQGGDKTQGSEERNK